MTQDIPPVAAQASGIFLADFEATLDEVSHVCAELNLLAAARGGDEWAMQIDLGLTEALTNVVRHGYGPGHRGRILLECHETGPVWQLTVRDSGKPIPAERLRAAAGSVFAFDPDDLQSLPEGGMGLALIRTCFDRMDYVSHADSNLLTLTKLLGRLAC